MVIPHQVPWHGRLLARAAHALIEGVASTVRFELDASAEPDIFQQSAPVIFCAWHNRLAFSTIIYNKFIREAQPTRRLAAMVSASKDGALLARILELFHAQPVRGSTRRRGPQALLELTRWAERGCDLAITPDGPRGPKYHVQEGVILLASLTGLPILPISYRLSRKFELNSWDRFLVPIPLSRCQIRLGKSVRVAREISGAEREELRHQLETIMIEISQ